MTINKQPVSSVQDLYHSSGEIVRGSFGSDEASAMAYYAPYVNFVSDLIPISVLGHLSLLDVGCGNGWSTLALGKAGYQSLGIDLNAGAFEAPQSERVELRYGSALDLQFEDNRFDVVTIYSCLEHVPDPTKALAEMCRVCKKGGHVVIVGPNLLSPTTGFSFLFNSQIRKTIPFVFRKGQARYPYGNTKVGIALIAALRSFQLAAKLIRRSPHFLKREPDTCPPFHADNDSCYFCNPTDLIKYFQCLAWQVVRKGKQGRFPGAYLLAGGTWVAAKKPQ